MTIQTCNVLMTRVYLRESSDVLDDILDYLKNDAKIRAC